jgi:hypothetical protein
LIAVVGSLVDGDAAGDGTGVSAKAIAEKIAAAGGRAELVGVVPGDASGDERLLDLAEQGVGHAAVLRSPASGLDPADLELALRYLPDIRAVVLVGDDALLPTAAASASWSGAGLIVVTATGAAALELPGDAIVLEPPSTDRDGTFAGFVATLANRIDSGEVPGAAWRSTLSSLAVDQVRSPAPR